jgi:hypothetical protein
MINHVWPQLTTEVYRIPNAVLMSDSADIAGSFGFVDVLKIMPVAENGNNEATGEVNEVTESSTHPNGSELQQPQQQAVQNERILYSRTSNDSKMSNRFENLINSDSDQQPSMIPFDAWLKSHASERGELNSAVS